MCDEDSPPPRASHPDSELSSASSPRRSTDRRPARHVSNMTTTTAATARSIFARIPNSQSTIGTDNSDDNECMVNSSACDTPRERYTRKSMFISEVSTYTGLRGYLAALLMTTQFDLLMGFVIIANIGVMVIETDMNAPCAQDKDVSKCEHPAIIAINYAFLAVYTVEFFVRLFVLHVKVFYSLWNVLDFVVVLLGYVDVALTFMQTESMPGPSLSLLRIFRVFRLLRAVRVFQKIPELYAMLRGFVSAMQSMFWGFVMIIVLLLIFGVLCVELIHPISLQINEDNIYCYDAFGNVWFCMVMFFQTLVAGDSWGHCAIPVIKEEAWTFAIFAGALICVQLGFMNLILAVIVERASRAKDEDEEEIKKERRKNEMKATSRLHKIFAAIDMDGSGTISLEELLDGFDTNPEMQNIFAKLDFSKKDLSLLFDLMDSEDEGELSYEYLIENLRMTQSGDDRKSLTMLRLQASEIARSCKKLHIAHPHSSSSPPPKKSPRNGDNSSNPAVSKQSSEVSVSRCAAPQTGAGPRAEVLDAGSFDERLAELQKSINRDFASLRDSLTRLSDTIFVACRTAPTWTMGPDTKYATNESALSNGYMRENSDGYLDGDVKASLLGRGMYVMTAPPPSEPPRSPAMRLAAMVGDTSMRVDKGVGFGEVSL